MREFLMKELMNPHSLGMLIVKISILLALVRILSACFKNRSSLLRMWFIRIGVPGIILIMIGHFISYKIEIPLYNIDAARPETKISQGIPAETAQGKNMESVTIENVSTKFDSGNPSAGKTNISDPSFANKKVVSTEKKLVENNADEKRRTVEKQEISSDKISPASIAFWIVLFIWVGGILFQNIKRAIQFINIKKFTNDLSDAPAGVKKVILEIADGLGLEKFPQVFVSEKALTPVLIGVMQPKLIIPKTMIDRESDDVMQGIYIHELTHYRNNDIFWKNLINFFYGILWIHPFAWGLSEAHSYACEEYADQMAISYIGESEEYSGALARLALEITEKNRIYGIPFAREAEVLRRIKMLKRINLSKTIKPLYLTFVMSVLLLLSSGISLIIPVANNVIADESGKNAEIGNAVQTETVEVNNNSIPSSVRDETAIAKYRDDAVVKGDLIKAFSFEMERVMLRKKEGHLYKDKIDLNSIYENWIAQKKPSLDEKKNLIAKLTEELKSTPDPEEYNWRYYYLISSVYRDIKDVKQETENMDKCLAEYPDVEYKNPAKFSKYQHLINERAGMIWDAEGVDKAENWALDKYKTDKKFDYFFTNWWENKYKEKGLSSRLPDLVKRVDEITKEKMKRNK